MKKTKEIKKIETGAFKGKPFSKTKNRRKNLQYKDIEASPSFRMRANIVFSAYFLVSLAVFGQARSHQDLGLKSKNELKGKKTGTIYFRFATPTVNLSSLGFQSPNASDLENNQFYGFGVCTSYGDVSSLKEEGSSEAEGGAGGESFELTLVLNEVGESLFEQLYVFKLTIKAQGSQIDTSSGRVKIEATNQGFKGIVRLKEDLKPGRELKSSTKENEETALIRAESFVTEDVKLTATAFNLAKIIKRFDYQKKQIQSDLKFQIKYPASSNNKSPIQTEQLIQQIPKLNLSDFLYGFSLQNSTDPKTTIFEIEARKNKILQLNNPNNEFQILLSACFGVCISTIILIGIAIRDERRYPKYSMASYLALTLPLFYLAEIFRNYLGIVQYSLINYWLIIDFLLLLVVIRSVNCRNLKRKIQMTMIIVTSVFHIILVILIFFDPDDLPVTCGLFMIMICLEHLLISKNNWTAILVWVLGFSTSLIYYYFYYSMESWVSFGLREQPRRHTIYLVEQIVGTFLIILTLFLGKHIKPMNSFKIEKEKFIKIRSRKNQKGSYFGKFASRATGRTRQMRTVYPTNENYNGSDEVNDGGGDSGEGYMSSSNLGRGRLRSGDYLKGDELIGRKKGMTFEKVEELEDEVVDSGHSPSQAT